MRWEKKPHPKEGDTKVIRKFALWPREIENHWVWWEYYHSHYRWQWLYDYGEWAWLFTRRTLISKEETQ